MIRIFRTICLSTALMFLLVAAASGQAVNATLLGTVTDATEAVVAGAKVVVTEMNTGVSRATQTNDNGNYSFPNLPPGVYSVSVEMAGFRKETRQGVTAAVNSAARADMRLQPGSVSERASK